MTGGSLGQRTSSYGSLHQQQQQLPNSVVLPSLTNHPITRKPSKMLLSGGSREKERFLQRICKFASRRRVGMLLVVVVSVVVFMSVLSSVTKDEDAPEGPDVDDRSAVPVQNDVSNDSLPLNYPKSSFTNEEKYTKMDNSSSLTNIVPISGENQAKPLPPAVSDALPSGHPCEKFALPPPPADKKRTGPRPCPVCYLPVEQARDRMPLLPSLSPILRNLTYVKEENSIRTEPFGGSEFGGYPSLKQRSDSFEIKESMSVHCGFVKGSKPGRHTGFDMDDADLFEMEQCNGIVVASAIFGNYDVLQQPKNISEAAKTNICFFMFVDKETEEFMRNSSVINDKKKVGIWRIVIVNNLPYTDARRNGKVPKLLLHRFFPYARFSIWIDGKLELIVDPYQILERFLWRKNVSFAISRHYRRFDVFVEAEANKAAAKYDNASIDYQVEFYKKEGLTPYSEAKLPITSDVPEGCVIIREHIPITNLFTCLWFNEVDRFTSRDQISFSTVRDKIMSKVNWSMNMFLDCERRNFVVQAYHRDLLEHMSPPLHIIAHPPPLPPPGPPPPPPPGPPPPPPPQPPPGLPLTFEPPPRPSPEIITERIATARTPPRRRGRDRRSGSRRHHLKTAASMKDDNSA